ncbi:HD domain-containing phosphohydrolase [Kineococcus arenarius]|uniref:HD domain-containing phosphohydrolase n=1 Tax=Kineococcus sp. SYSU DK007 TaxID=3383128 RepID=UPI003D7C4996
MIRVAEILAALSLTTDVAAGMEFEKGLRTCAVAVEFATSVLQVDTAAARCVFETSLLRSIGCTSFAPELAELFGDDVAVQAVLKTLDPDARTGARGSSATLAGSVLAAMPTTGVQAVRNGCETSRSLGAELGLLPASITALDDVYERWDGRGVPTGRRGEELSLVARIVHTAEQAVLAHAAGGAPAAVAELRRRAGEHLDPALAQSFAAAAPTVLAPLREVDAFTAVLAAEPHPHTTVPFASVERLCAVLARVVDLKSRWLLGHSEDVAAVAGAAGEALGFDRVALTEVRCAALVHDLGRVGVSSAVWDLPGPLSVAQVERVRMHTYWTQRVLARVPALAPLAVTAASHHERLNGSGYHGAIPSAGLPLPARLLAAADVFAALTEPRAHRAALSAPAAAQVLVGQAADGLLDREAVAAITCAAGGPVAPVDLPAGLSRREVEVLRLAARGLSNREIGQALSISPRTAGHHLTHIYDKTGRRTRAGIAVFAMQHHLLR